MASTTTSEKQWNVDNLRNYCLSFGDVPRYQFDDPRVDECIHSNVR